LVRFEDYVELTGHFRRLSGTIPSRPPVSAPGER
jgi:hypothetical protein